MAIFVAVSGPSSTGKTLLVDSLSTYPVLSSAIFSPDIHTTVWRELVEKGVFSEWSEINRDSEYLCVYILRLINYYEEYLDSFKESNKIIIMDGSWIDLAIYSLINLWYSKALKEVQEDIFSRINKFSSHISKIYMTEFRENRQEVQRYRMPYRIANMKVNRPLELQYYSLFSNFYNTDVLPSNDTTADSLIIINDLKDLGYI